VSILSERRTREQVRTDVTTHALIDDRDLEVVNACLRRNRAICSNCCGVSISVLGRSYGGERESTDRRRTRKRKRTNLRTRLPTRPTTTQVAHTDRPHPSRSEAAVGRCLPPLLCLLRVLNRERGRR
jgi:hypothetical protein